MLDIHVRLKAAGRRDVTTGEKNFDAVGNSRKIPLGAALNWNISVLSLFQ